MSREYARLKEISANGERFLKVRADLAQHAEMLKTEPTESEMAQLAREEIAGLQAEEKVAHAENPSRRSCRRTRPIPAIPSSKSARARAVRNRPCSPPIFTG